MNGSSTIKKYLSFFLKPYLQYSEKYLRYLLQSFKIIFQLSLKHCVFLFHELIKPIIQNNIFIILPNKIHRDHMWQTWLGLGGPNYAELELHTNIGKVARSSNFLIHHMKSWTQPGWETEIFWNITEQMKDWSQGEG